MIFTRKISFLFKGLLPFFFVCLNLLAEERIAIEGRINHAAARLFFDTGARYIYLFKPAAERLGLSVGDRPPLALSPRERQARGRPPESESSDWDTYWAEKKYDVAFPGVTSRIKLAILEMPSYLGSTEYDGILGWGEVSQSLLSLDAANKSIEFLDRPPPQINDWQSFRVLRRKPGSLRRIGILAIEIPQEHQPPGIVLIDTGSETGVGLPEKLWSDWKAAHPSQPYTLSASSMPALGIVVREQSFANELNLGPLRLRNVVVEESEPWSSQMAGRKHLATFGMAALSRMDLFVDGKHRKASFRAKDNVPATAPHNRMGAVFVPQDAESGDLIAQVAPNSPAFEAGIRNGDKLLAVNGRDIRNWQGQLRTAPAELTFWERPAGTRLTIKVQRGSEIFEMPVVLRDILTPLQSKDKLSFGNLFTLNDVFNFGAISVNY